jgi:Tfp pilus assembly protein PilF
MGKRLEKSETPNATGSNHESYRLGCAAFDAGRFSEAKHFFREALDYWPEDYQAWWAMGNCYDSLGKPEKAEDCFRKSLEWNDVKSEPELLFNLGNSLFDQQRYSEAAEIYSKISAQSAVWPKAQRNLNLIEADQG